jgi:hypothetical protein
VLEFSFSPSNTPFKPSATALEPDNTAVEVDQPLSRKILSDRKAPPPKHSKTAAPLASEITPDSCVYDPHSTSQIVSEMRKILLEPIGRGVIYILEAPKFFENYKPASNRGEIWVMIGITSDLPERIKTLKSRCGFTQLTAPYVSEPVRMDLLERIEKLCYEELNNFRRRMDCKHRPVAGGKCDTVHEEWFAVDYEIAETTVKRWRTFLKYDPYWDDGYMTISWKERVKDKFSILDTIDGKNPHALGHELDAWLEESIDDCESWNRIFNRRK